MSKNTTALPTIWEVPDELWAVLQPLLDKHDPPKPRGRKRVDARRALNGIIYRLRTGCQWNHLPHECGDDSSVHRTLQRWENKGVFLALWAVLLTHCDELQGVQWEWQAADGCLSKARGVPRQAGAADNPRAAKKGRKTKPSARTLPIGAKRA